VIRSFADEGTRTLFERGRTRKYAGVANVARRKLTQVDAAAKLSDLIVPRGNRLEALSGDREGQYSIRINDQYRVCFRWENDEAHDVEVTDYH